MSAEGTLPQAVRDRIGVETVRHYEVTARDVRRFAQAIGSPITSDVAPPLFCQVYMFQDVPVGELPPDGSPKELDVPVPASRTVGGGSDFETLGDVRVGDTITVRSRLRDVDVKRGKSGRLYLVAVETEFRNQRGELVARETATYVKRGDGP